MCNDADRLNLFWNNDETDPAGQNRRKQTNPVEQNRTEQNTLLSVKTLTERPNPMFKGTKKMKRDVDKT